MKGSFLVMLMTPLATLTRKTITIMMTNIEHLTVLLQSALR